MSDTNSKWTRMAKAASALRGDRLSLVLTQKGWQATHEGIVHHIQAPSIADAIEEAIAVADILLSPAGWEYAKGNWVRAGWMISPQGTGWNIYKHTDDTKERASVRDFTSADRARRWVEVRLDRTGTNLRGPKPRAGRKSNCKLPDVRVTEGEKAAAMTRLKTLGLSYSQFVRASLRFADEYLTMTPADESDWVVTTIEGKAEFRLYPDTFLGEPNTGTAERSEGVVSSGSVESKVSNITSSNTTDSPYIPAWATLKLGGIAVLPTKEPTDGQ
jgi:hypothetical protein